MANKTLTIAIVTKKRPDKLRRCLESVVQQTTPPDWVLIIDNDPAMSAKKTCTEFINALPIQYLLDKRPGVSNARNTALTLSNTKYLGFVDDDCILDKKWVENCLNIVRRKRNICYVCGKTKLYNTKNLCAIAQQVHDSYWLTKKINSKNELLSGGIDTKNLILFRHEIVARKLRFDSKCSIKNFDSADLDFGLQLTQQHLKGIYSSNLIVYHEETSKFNRYVMRGYYRGKIAAYVNQKWNLRNSLANIPDSSILRWAFRKVKNLPKDLKLYTSKMKLPLIYKIMIGLTIALYEGAYIKGYRDFKYEK